ncbi:MAG TPA: acetolactate synthase small subunit [Acidimicrobiales bacterium]|nr:acetolactate synthase small subunit [Acidimicrobiales bacterium]
MSKPQHHVLSVLVNNQAGVLARVSNLFARRAYNIFSLAVAPTDDERFSRITIVVDVSGTPLEQISNQLNKLIDVVQITELHPDDSVERELLLATVSTTGKGSRGEIMELVQVFNGRVVDVGHDAVTVSVTSSPDTIDGFEDLVRPYGITALARTGRVALAKLEKQAPEAKILKNKKAG